MGRRALHTAASVLCRKDVPDASGDISTTIRERDRRLASGKKDTGDSRGEESKGSQDSR